MYFSICQTSRHIIYVIPCFLFSLTVAYSQDSTEFSLESLYMLPNELPGIGRPIFTFDNIELGDTSGILPPIGIIEVQPVVDENFYSFIDKAGLTQNLASQRLIEVMNPGISWDNLSGTETIFIPQFNQGFWRELSGNGLVTIYDEFDQGTLKEQSQQLGDLYASVSLYEEFVRVPEYQVELTLSALNAAAMTADAILESAEISASFASFASQDSSIVEEFALQVLQDRPLEQNQVEALQYIVDDLREQSEQLTEAPTTVARYITVRVVNKVGMEINGLRVWFAGAAYHIIGKHQEHSTSLWQLSSPAMGPVERVGRIVFWATDAYGQRIVTEFQEANISHNTDNNPPDITLLLKIE